MEFHFEYDTHDDFIPILLSNYCLTKSKAGKIINIPSPLTSSLHIYGTWSTTLLDWDTCNQWQICYTGKSTFIIQIRIYVYVSLVVVSYNVSILLQTSLQSSTHRVFVYSPQEWITLLWNTVQVKMFTRIFILLFTFTLKYIKLFATFVIIELYKISTIYFILHNIECTQTYLTICYFVRENLWYMVL